MVQVIQSTGRTQRKLRQPVYQFQVRTKPWAITPFMLAPVLPGETLKNIKMQSRVITDPIANPIIGWWKEYYWFYVKLRDMSGTADYEEMMLDPAKDMSSYRVAADPLYYHSYGINWAKRATETVVKEYFRAEDEALVQNGIHGYYEASLNIDSWLDSAMLESAYDDPADVNVDLNANATITVGEIDRARTLYEFAQLNNLTDMDFEDYLRTFGIRLPQAEKIGVPEMLRYTREWSYPANTVDPATGVPSSAVSWGIAERVDKDRLFKEPGFILGLTIARPKVYLSNQKGSPTGLLDNAFSWLPAVMADDIRSSIVQIDTVANGPLQNQTNPYIFDMKDLFLYGEQWVNFAVSATDAGMIAMPTAGLQKRYPTEAMADILFKAETAELVKEDGRCDLKILGSLMDTTPSVSRQGV